jgi:hypothetical protein
MRVKKPTIKFVDRSRFVVECRACAGEWAPFLRNGGRICRGGLTCPWCGQKHRNVRKS